MKQSRRTYALAGTAASYFASKICESISTEIVISQHPSRVLIQTVQLKGHRASNAVFSVLILHQPLQYDRAISSARADSDKHY
jgi:hypothetical protein